MLRSRGLSYTLGVTHGATLRPDEKYDSSGKKPCTQNGGCKETYAFY